MGRVASHFAPLDRKLTVAGDAARRCPLLHRRSLQAGGAPGTASAGRLRPPGRRVARAVGADTKDLVARANERLEAADATALPENLTPHQLRHTFASLLVALGTDPGAVMDQFGHTDPTFTLRVYRYGMRRDEDSRAQLSQLVGDVKRQRQGSSGDSTDWARITSGAGHA